MDVVRLIAKTIFDPGGNIDISLRRHDRPLHCLDKGLRFS